MSCVFEDLIESLWRRWLGPFPVAMANLAEFLFQFLFVGLATDMDRRGSSCFFVNFTEELHERCPFFVDVNIFGKS